jgi:hypothetical protein
MIPSVNQFGKFLGNVGNRVGAVAREARDIPTAIGTIEIKVEDIALPESSPAISILHISNIAQLKLHSIGSLIE